MAKGTYPEISVAATPNDSFATVKWQFTRKGVAHRFQMQVYAQGAPLIKDHELQLIMPSGARYQRTGEGLPQYIHHTFKTSDHTYRDMIESVMKIITKHDLIVAAQTDPRGFTSVRDPEFVYPAYREKRAGYDPRAMRLALLASTSTVTPKRAIHPLEWPLAPTKTNGKTKLTRQGELALPVPGKIEKSEVEVLDPMQGVIEIIEKHMPEPVSDDGYVKGVTDMQKQVDEMRRAIASQIAQFEKPPRNEQAIKIYSGYDKLLNSIMQRSDMLLVMHAKARRDEGLMASVELILEAHKSA